jgi:hypothetical protein
MVIAIGAASLSWLRASGLRSSVLCHILLGYSSADMLHLCADVGVLMHPHMQPVCIV